MASMPGVKKQKREEEHVGVVDNLRKALELVAEQRGSKVGVQTQRAMQDAIDTAGTVGTSRKAVDNAPRRPDSEGNRAPMK